MWNICVNYIYEVWVIFPKCKGKKREKAKNREENLRTSIGDWTSEKEKWLEERNDLTWECKGLSCQSKGVHCAQHRGSKQTRGIHSFSTLSLKRTDFQPGEGTSSHLKNQGYLWTSWQQHRHQEGNSTVLKFWSETITNWELYS